MVMTKDDLLALIGEPTNNKLRELKRLLTQYVFTPNELMLLYSEIMSALSEADKRKRAA